MITLFKIFVYSIILLVLIVLSLANNHQVEVNLFLTEHTVMVPLFVVFFSCLLLGAMLCYLNYFGSMIKMKLSLRKKDSRLKSLEKKLDFDNL